MSLHEDRIEKTLGSVTGDYDGQIPEPQSRIEVLLQKILENGGGSGDRGIPGIILNESQYDIHGVPIIDNPIEDVYYMVPNTDSEQGGYIIYMYVDEEWVNIGTTYEQDETVIERAYEEFSELKSAILTDTRNIFDDIVVKGTINTSTGADAPSNTQMRGDSYLPATEGWYYIKIGNADTNKRYIAYWYASDKSFINRTSWGTSQAFYAANSSTKDVAFIRIALDTDYGTTYNNDIYISKLTDNHAVVPHETANDAIAREGSTYASSLFEKYISTGEYDFQIDWMNGNINNTTGALTIGTSNRIFTAQIIAPSIDIAVYSDSDVGFWLFEYTSPTTVTQIGLLNGLARKMEKGKNYRLLCGYTDSPSTNIATSEGMKIKFVPLNNSKNELKICQFNVGKWYRGATDGCPSEYVTEQKNKWRDFIGDKNIDVLCTNEYYQTFAENGDTTPYDEILHIGFTTVLNISGKQDAALTKVPIVSFRQENLPSGTEAWRFEILLGGHIVHCVFTHLSTEETPSRRTADLAAINTLAHQPYTIICADTNIRDISEWSVFSGVNLANGGLWGDIKTLVDGTSAGYTNRCVDNIITSVDIEISAVNTTDVIMSDHYPIIARLLIK